MKMILGLFLVVVSLCSVALAGAPEKYADWKDRPQEKFSSGEESFKLAMDKILQEYAEKSLTKDDLYRAATAGMLEALNAGEHSWNTMLTPHELKEIQADLSGQISGIGVELKFDEASGSAGILSVIPHSPAEKAGLRRDDQILSIDGLKNKGKSFRDIVAAVRGKTGAPLSLKILRDEKIMTLNIKRDVVAWTPVELTKIDNATELLTIGYFTGGTPKLVEEKMAAINSASVKNLIIDLRNNSGGSFEKAVQTAELFVPQGQRIVSTKNRDGKTKDFVSTKGLLRKDINVLVLTNGETSSGAELFAGALKDQLGAKTVGEKTLGKWNAQMIETLPNGFAIKFTTQYFQTPEGHSYQNVGLKPDIEVALPKGMDPKELQSKYDIKKRLEMDTQLKAATELVKAM